MKNEEIKLLLLKHADLCMILKYRELTPEENATLLEIEEKLDALPETFPFFSLACPLFIGKLSTRQARPAMQGDKIKQSNNDETN